MNIRFQNALRGVAQPIPPIWFMRQAGRYHKHYQALRARYSFMDLCKTPELASQVALGPIQDFDFDTAILFSDLLFPLEALGMGLTYEPGPKLGWHLTAQNLAQLKPWKEALPCLQFQAEAMRATRAELPKDKSLIGFVGGPWTLFTYAIEGEHKGNLIEAKTHLPLFHQFREVLKPLLQANIELQLNAGAEVVMIFDTAAGELSPHVFHQHLVEDLNQLANAFPTKLGYYAKASTAEFLSPLRACEAWAGFGVDHRLSLPHELRRQTRGFLQGNFDQALLFSEKLEFRQHLQRYLAPFREMDMVDRRHWVCGLGHGVLPKTPEDNVREFVATVREIFAR